MLYPDFYTTEHLTIADNYLEVLVRLNPKHFIFDSHFPGNPIMPGVCTLQIVREIYSDKIGKELLLHKIKSMKFNHPIIPTEQELVTFKISIMEEEGKSHHLKVEVCDQEILFSKINMHLQEVE